jgi:2-polyprenyl-3-methyl-5-hydroxy-6-metoxy-1,4-benzoquinol methylase
MPTTDPVFCDLCGGDNPRVIQEAESPFKVVRCNNCGLAFVAPLPDVDSLSTHYHHEEYYRAWIEKQKAQRLRLWQRRFRDMQRFRRSGKLLDVGCGLGTFVKISKDNGFDATGTEVSDFAVQYAYEAYGLNIIPGALEALRFPDDCFDVVTIWHVLEHLPSPRATLTEIHRILKKGGMLAVAVPNINEHIFRFAYRLVRGRELKLFSVDDKELHLYHFSQKTLQLILEKTGFEVEHMGVDLCHVEWAKRLIDHAAMCLWRLTGINFAGALQAYAVKK